MALPLIEIIIMSIGCIVTLFWLFIYMKSLKYAPMFDGLNEKEFPLKELYCTGYCMLEMIHYSYKTKKDRKDRDKLEILYEPKYADYYLRVGRSQQLTISALLIVLAFPLYGLADDVIMLGLLFMFAGLAYYYYGRLVTEKIGKRTEAMIDDFSEVVSKLALLINAGMILREAWEKIAFSGEGDLYLEMQKAVDNMNNGISEKEAVRQFGVRCMMAEVKKFASTVIQGIEKGNRELAIVLKQQNGEVWDMKKHWARRKGEQAASQLLIPMMIMFFGIIVLVVVPVFTNLGM